jgi:osmoprotectant transport system ATP-binding protein
VFVTHDIDEAIKLGDQVAVLRVGGKLAQLATPAELLSRPTDAFVAGFVGRDRGYRALGFAHAGSLPFVPEPAVSLGAPLSAIVGHTEDGWVLVVDDQNRPQGWLYSTGEPTGQPESASVITPELLNLGGTLAAESDTLRAVLDAALSSPSGRGVVVDEAGRLRGTITAFAVLTEIERNAGQNRAALGQAAVAG